MRDSQAPLRRTEGGQGLVEYALLIGAGVVLVILGMLFLGGRLDDLFSRTGTEPGTFRPPTAQCDPNYGACVPSPPPVLSCDELAARGIPLPVAVIGSDPHGLDPDGDGSGC